MSAPAVVPSHNLIDWTGKRVGRLRIRGRATPIGEKPIRWSAVCDCGRWTTVRAGHLTKGHTQSCGCLRVVVSRAKALRHGHAPRQSRTKTYRVWSAMLRRCLNANSKPYKWYGGRGITVCERWHSFANFLADMGEPPEGRELDRIDNNGNYEPGNCRWVTHQENCQNRRSATHAR